MCFFQTPPSRSAVIAASNLGGTKYESRLEPGGMKYESRLEPDLDDDECEDDDDEGGFDPWAVTIPQTRFLETF